ncbi:MAG: glutamate synthase [Faecalispora jeddahensis]|uniref:GltB/FmdC/FwdC-like GXGXG domain-containing protein n=1 Tax=Faecalispora jeddahensis TaxID=1414721 RepID=UPI0039968E8B
MRINATNNLNFRVLNEQIRNTEDKNVIIDNCLGQRFIGSGMGQRKLTINGTPGNALGAYLNGADIEVNGNAQDATGDTMNNGSIVIHGNCGDATGYGMRGGEIYIKGNVGFRAGIHMKAYQENSPVMVVGGKAGSFLGEYQAGGTIIVLGLNEEEQAPVGAQCCTGMHGGCIFLRCDSLPEDLPAQVVSRKATKYDLEHIDGYLKSFCEHFSVEKEQILEKPFYVLEPNTNNPYRSIYTTYLS